MHDGSVANFILQGIHPLSFRERVKTRMKWSERGETDPEQVRHMTIEIAMVLEEEEENRALDEEMDRKRRPGSLEQGYNNSDQHWNAGGSRARVRVGVGTGG